MSCDRCIEYIHSLDDEELHLALPGCSSKLACRPVQRQDSKLETWCSVRSSNCLKALADGFQPHIVGDFQTEFDRTSWTCSAPHQTKKARGKIGSSSPQSLVYVIKLRRRITKGRRHRVLSAFLSQRKSDLQRLESLNSSLRLELALMHLFRHRQLQTCMTE